jgi:seryl-tRNA synthetase
MERPRTIEFINSYFNRADAFNSLIEKRGFTEDELGKIFDSNQIALQANQSLEQMRAERNRLSETLKDPTIRNSDDGFKIKIRSIDIGKEIPLLKSNAAELANEFQKIRSLELEVQKENLNLNLNHIMSYYKDWDL